MAPIDDLAQALNHRDITDEEGQVVEENETPQEESPTLDQQTAAEEDAQVEKPAESEVKESQSKTDDNEIQFEELASDETGKRYVPESRFKEVYGKMKELQRSLENQAKTKTSLPLPKIDQKPLDKTDQVEIELLRATLPQFNPDNADYSRELDELGFAYYKANPGVSRIEAARMALSSAKKLQAQKAKVEQEVRTVKSIESDQGITSRVTSRGGSENTPPEDASPEELENWLKTHGAW